MNAFKKVRAEKKVSGWQASLAVRMAEAKPAEAPKAEETPGYGGLVCTDCGQQATVWRDLGRGVSSCAACEAKYRARQAEATAPKPQKRSKAERQAAMAARIAARKGSAPAAAEQPPATQGPPTAPTGPTGPPPGPTAATGGTGAPEAATGADRPVPEPARPVPEPGQVWSAPSPTNGRRYVRVMEIEHPGTQDAVAVCDEINRDGSCVHKSQSSPFPNGLRHNLARGEMQPPYRYEAELTATTTTPEEGTDSADEAQETTMSANHTNDTTKTPKAKAPKAKSAKAPKVASTKKAKSAKATKSGNGHTENEAVTAFAEAMFAKDATVTRAKVIAAFRASGKPCGEIRLRELIEAAKPSASVIAKAKAAKKEAAAA